MTSEDAVSVLALIVSIIALAVAVAGWAERR